MSIDESAATVALQLDSLELDIQTLQREHEDDQKEFKEFQSMVNRNFATTHKNFDKIQENSRRLLLEPELEELSEEQYAKQVHNRGRMQAEHDSLVLAYIPSDTRRPLLVYSSSPPVLMVKGKMSDFYSVRMPTILNLDPQNTVMMSLEDSMDTNYLWRN